MAKLDKAGDTPTAQIDEIARVLQDGKAFLLTTSSPDGDAVGSMLALGLALRKHDKHVQVFSPEPLPENLEFLPGMDLVTYEIPPRAFDAMVVMDTGSSKLLFKGDRKLWEKISGTVIAIDHHPDNDRYGHLNWVAPESASTGEIVFQLFTRLKWEISTGIAECILTAVMADTGAFRYPNVSPATFEIAADLLAKGANSSKIARKLYACATPAYVKLLGKMFLNLHYELNGKLAWSVLGRSDFKECAAPDDTADKMVEQLDVLRDVKAYALLRQMGDGKIKVGLRSRDNLPVNKIAAQFGGGGHLQAAGCRLEGDLAEAEKKIVAELRKLFGERGVGDRSLP